MRSRSGQWAIAFVPAVALLAFGALRMTEPTPTTTTVTTTSTSTLGPGEWICRGADGFDYRTGEVEAKRHGGGCHR